MSDQDSPGAVETNPTDIRYAAMNLLSRREHSVLELRNKLRRRFSDAENVDKELSRLSAENLQSDVRFAGSYLRQRSDRGYGPVRLREELRQRGVSDTDAAAAMDDSEIDWCALAAEVMHKKFGPPVADNLKEKARRTRFMQYRGFCSDHYRHLL